MGQTWGVVENGFIAHHVVRAIMPSTIKEPFELENLAKPDSHPGSPDQKQERSSRSNPVCLEVPVTIRSLPSESGAKSGSGGPVREEARTVIVFESGAVLRLSSKLPAGQSVIVSNARGRDVVCRVVVARTMPTVKGYIEIEFVEQVNDFWGIEDSAPVPPTNISAPVPTGPTAGPVPPVTIPVRAAAESASSVIPDQPTAPSAGSGPSFEDIPGLVQFPSQRREVRKPAVISSRASVLENPAELDYDPIAALKPRANVSAPIRPSDSKSYPEARDDAAASGRISASPSIHNISGNSMLGASQTSATSAPGGSRGKMPLIIAGMAVILVGSVAGFFFLHRGSNPSSNVSQSVVVQPSQNGPTTEVASSSEGTQPAKTSPADSISKPRSTVSGPEPALSVGSLTSSEAALPAVPQSSQHAAISPVAEQPESSRHKLPSGLQMKAPIATNRNTTPADSTTFGGIDIASTISLAAAPLAGALPSVGRSNSQPAPPPPPPASVLAGSPRGITRQPKLISAMRPAYPAAAKQSNVHGIVVVIAEIDVNGKVNEVVVTSGPNLLRRAAVDAVRESKYQPALLNGKPIATQITVNVDFQPQ